MDLHDDALKIVRESQIKHIQENTFPLIVEAMDLLRQVVLVQHEILLTYDQAPKALLAFLPKEQCKMSDLTQEQKAALDILKECVKLCPLCDKYSELMQQVASKHQELQYISELSTNNPQ